MSEDDDFDELPPISVNTSRDEIVFTMPSADVLASQRARQHQLELELSMLRDQNGGCQVSHPNNSDSSGSEGEETLAAAVDALLVEPTKCSRLRPPAQTLLAAMLTALPHPKLRLLEEFLDAADHLHPSVVETLAYEMMVSMSEMVSWEDKMWSDEEALGVGLWLCAALTWSTPPVPRLRSARALRTLLADRCNTSQVCSLSSACCTAFADSPTRLELYSAVAGAQGGGAHFAQALLTAALADALHHKQSVTADGIVEAISGAWRALDATEQLAVVQLVGRALAHGWFSERQGARRVLDALAVSAPATARHTLERLKVLVEVSKLRCLFVPNNTEGRRGEEER